MTASVRRLKGQGAEPARPPLNPPMIVDFALRSDRDLTRFSRDPDETESSKTASLRRLETETSRPRLHA